MNLENNNFVEDKLKEFIDDSIEKIESLDSIAVFVSGDVTGNNDSFAGQLMSENASEDAVGAIARMLKHLSLVVSSTASNLARDYVTEDSAKEKVKREFIYAICASALGVVSNKNISSDEGKMELMNYLNEDMENDVSAEEDAML